MRGSQGGDGDAAVLTVTGLEHRDPSQRIHDGGKSGPTTQATSGLTGLYKPHYRGASFAADTMHCRITQQLHRISSSMGSQEGEVIVYHRSSQNGYHIPGQKMYGIEGNRMADSSH